MRHLIAAILPLPLVLGCAMAPVSASPADLSVGQAQFVAATCSGVLGLRPGEVYYGDCQDSLSHTLIRKIAAETGAVDEETCRHQGLKDGTPQFAMCVMNGNGSHSETVPATIDLTPVADQIKKGTSFYNVTPTVQFQRERYACAQMGLTPNTNAFASCTGSLEGAFMPDSN